jgi:hypothetical protein
MKEHSTKQVATPSKKGRQAGQQAQRGRAEQHSQAGKRAGVNARGQQRGEDGRRGEQDAQAPGRRLAITCPAALMPARSEVVWENLDDFARLQIQQWVQRLLEEELTDLMGREKSERRSQAHQRQAQDRLEAGLAHPYIEEAAGAFDLHFDLQGGMEQEGCGWHNGTAQSGEGDWSGAYRNGHGKPRRLTTTCGTITVQRPRVRGLQERFVSQVLPLFTRRTREVGELLPELYLHGLSMGDFDLALRGLLGEEAPLSASSIARLKAVWQAEYETWQRRDLSEMDVVYAWVDGIYVKAGLEKDKAALLVVIGALSDGRKVVLAVKAGQRESIQSWSEVLRDLKSRGMRCPKERSRTSTQTPGNSGAGTTGS